MDEADIRKYAGAMKEIKLRIEVITLFLTGQREARYMPTTVETVGLQFRKVFELIAFASLAANRAAYSSAYSDFAKHWEAAKLVKNLRRINLFFYSQPVVETLSLSGAPRSLAPRQKGYMEEAELVEAHGRCGSLMHAANPFGQPIDHPSYQKAFHTWLPRTMNLLNCHQVHLPGDTGFWVIHMKEDSDDEVHYYRFERQG
jgi:hypothetical protein